MLQRKVLFEQSKDFFHYNDLVRRISGLWIPGKDRGLIFKVLYYSYVLIFYFMGLSFMFLEILVLEITLTELSKLMTLIGILLTHIVGVFKLATITLQRGKIKKLMGALQDPKYEYISISIHKPKEIFEKERKIHNVITIAMFCMYTFAALSSIMSMYMKVSREVQEEIFEGTNVTCYDYLTYFHYIYLNINTKSKCMAYSFFQGVSVLYYSFIIACADGIFVGLNNCLQIQFKILGGTFRTLRERTLHELKLPEDYTMLHDEENPKLEKTMTAQLSLMINHLNLLISVRDEIEFLFSFVTLFQTVASLLIIASCLFIASTVSIVLDKEPVTSPEFYAKLQFFSCILLQLFLICWSGNRLTIAADQITTSLYECDWFSCSKRIKKSLLLTMIRMRRPLYLSIGKFSPLTLSTVITVCRGSFSYLTLFKSIQ